jgi:hypothetical protein
MQMTWTLILGIVSTLDQVNCQVEFDHILRHWMTMTPILLIVTMYMCHGRIHHHLIPLELRLKQLSSDDRVLPNSLKSVDQAK